MKKRNKVVLTSMASIAMCASMIAGGTYALFTSESEVNVAVTSGTVKVEATASDLTLYSKGVEQSGSTFEVGGTATKEGNRIKIDRMAPMDSVKFDIEIENYSDISVQYRTVISVVEDTGLFSALTVTFTEDEKTQIFGGGYAYADWTKLDATDNDATTADDVSTINVSIEFPDGENQNVYQGKSCEIAVTVEAVQGNADVVNPVTQTGERSWDVNSEEGMMLMNGIINSNDHGEGRELNFRLTDDMDMSGYAWNMPNVWMTNIDGNGKTVSNVACGRTDRGWSGFVSYFGGGRIKDLTLENVTAVGSQAGIVAGHADGGWLENVTIKGTNSVTYQENPVETWGGVGVVAGVSTEGLKAGSSISIADGATVSVNYNDILTESPYANEYAFINDISAYVTQNGTVTTTGDWWYKAYDAETLATGAKNSWNVKMVSDITAPLSGSAIYGTPVAVIQKGGVLDGNGYSLNIQSPEYEGFAIETYGGKIENLTITSTVGRGIIISSPKEDLYIDNVVVDGPGYAINTTEHNGKNLIVTNSTVRGWTSLAGLDSVTFTNCILGENTSKYWQNDGYGQAFDRLLKSYVNITFNACAFEADYYLDCSAFAGDDAIRFYKGCTVGGVEITTENLMWLFSTEVEDTYNDWKYGGAVDGEYVPIYVDDEAIVRYARLADGVGLMSDGTYGVYNAAGLNYINGIISQNVASVKLLADIDMSDYAWKMAEMHSDYYGILATFDGNNKTISNMKIDGDAMFSRLAQSGDLTIKNLTFDNVTVDTTSKNAAIITKQVYKNTTLDNVDVKNSKISGETKVATLVGSVYDEKTSVITLTVKDCDIENVTVTGNPEDKTEERLAGMVAWVADKYSNDTIVLENNTMTNVSIVSNSETEEHHAIIYISDESAEPYYGVYHDTDENVTVIDCKYVRAFVADSQDSLNSAISASTNVNVTLTEGNYSMISASNKDITITGTKDTVITVDRPNLSGSDVSFDGVTIKGSGNYTGVQSVNTVTYNNATIVGVMFLYGEKVVFNNCTFELDAEQYIWTYGAAEVEFNGCTFNSKGKALLVYGDYPGDLSTTTKVYVNDCKFYATSAVEGKAAIEIDSRFINMVVEINNTTSEGFDNGTVSGNSLWNNKKGNAATVTVDGKVIELQTAPNE